MHQFSDKGANNKLLTSNSRHFQNTNSQKLFSNFDQLLTFSDGAGRRKRNSQPGFLESAKIPQKKRKSISHDASSSPSPPATPISSPVSEQQITSQLILEKVLQIEQQQQKQQVSFKKPLL
jgi:hypothetical protein